MVLENTKTFIGGVNTLRIIRVFDDIRPINLILSTERHDTDPV